VIGAQARLPELGQVRVATRKKSKNVKKSWEYLNAWFLKTHAKAKIWISERLLNLFFIFKKNYNLKINLSHVRQKQK
jgi:hypothetical protein